MHSKVLCMLAAASIVNAKCQDNHPGNFGLQVVNINDNARRSISQISDGQIQHSASTGPTASESQTGGSSASATVSGTGSPSTMTSGSNGLGSVSGPTSASATNSGSAATGGSGALTQISDGQVQAPTSVSNIPTQVTLTLTHTETLYTTVLTTAIVPITVIESQTIHNTATITQNSMENVPIYVPTTLTINHVSTATRTEMVPTTVVENQTLYKTIKSVEIQTSHVPIYIDRPSTATEMEISTITVTLVTTFVKEGTTKTSTISYPTTVVQQSTITAAPSPYTYACTQYETITSQTKAPGVSQIGDGQVQAGNSSMMTFTTVIPKPTECVVYPPTPSGPASSNNSGVSSANASATESEGSSGGSGSVTSTPAPSDTAPSASATVSEIGDGQLQIPPMPTVSQIGDGQIQVPPTRRLKVRAKNEGVLSMTLENGILKDSQGRIGSIVANNQFQFDGPTQANAIATSGWAVCEGTLAIKGNKQFWSCQSGDFSNLYNKKIASYCVPVNLRVA